MKSPLIIPNASSEAFSFPHHGHAFDHDDGLRQKLRFTGTIDITWKDAVIPLTGMEIEIHGELAETSSRVRLTLDGPLGQLRKLALVDPAYAKVLAYVAAEQGDVVGALKAYATPALVADLAHKVPTPETTIQDLLKVEAWMALVFALDRYVPASITVPSD